MIQPHTQQRFEVVTFYASVTKLWGRKWPVSSFYFWWFDTRFTIKSWPLKCFINKRFNWRLVIPQKAITTFEHWKFCVRTWTQAPCQIIGLTALCRVSCEKIVPGVWAKYKCLSNLKEIMLCRLCSKTYSNEPEARLDVVRFLNLLRVRSSKFWNTAADSPLQFGWDTKLSGPAAILIKSHHQRLKVMTPFFPALKVPQKIARLTFLADTRYAG